MASKLRPSAMTARLMMFTSTTVRTRGTVFPLFSGAGMKPATETKLREFGEGVRVRPDEVEETQSCSPSPSC